jgi:hypothetical protein
MIGFIELVKVVIARTKAKKARDICIISIIFFRLNTSATDPPIKEKTTMGKNRVRPISPKAIAEFVRIYMCQLIATICICVPIIEISCPIQRSLKSRYLNAAKRSFVCIG